mmetsp:Transcript_36658/g.63877  ORF Transcript_36658/g.63877 Transcript_36658/m.63877 type:complete len:589 (-) Transcript_36658:176-1942(-)
MARRHRDYDESLSHEMSTLLRYKGPQRGLPMASDGFARFDDVATVLSRDPVRAVRGNLEQEMLEVVRESSKKGNPRFHLASYFAPSSSECVRLIRATRKHAIEGLDHGRIAQNLDPIGLPPPALAELGAGRPRRSHRHQPHQAFYPRPGQPGAMPPSQHTAQDHFPHPGHSTEEVQGPFAHPPPPMEAAPPSSSEASNAQQSAAGSMGLGPPLRQAGHCEWYDLTADDPRPPATSPPSAVPLSEAVPGPPPGPPPGYEEQKAAEDDVDPELIRGPGLDPWFAGADPWQQQSAASSASSAMPVPITPPATRPPASPSVAAPPAPAQPVGPALPIAPASPVAPAPSMALPMYNIGPAPTAPPPAPPATPLAVAQPPALPSSASPPGLASAVPAASVVQLPAQPVSLAPPAAPAPAMAPVGANAANAAPTVRVQMQQMQQMQRMQQLQQMQQMAPPAAAAPAPAAGMAANANQAAAPAVALEAQMVAMANSVPAAPQEAAYREGEAAEHPQAASEPQPVHGSSASVQALSSTSRWKQFRDEVGNYWLWNETTHDWFYENDPGDWKRYSSYEGKYWWFNEATDDWFFPSNQN